MSGSIRKLGAALFAGLLIAALPASVQAQDGPPYPLPDDAYSLDLYGGYDLPVQDLMDAFDPGPTVGLSFGRRVHEDVSLRLDAAATFYGEDEYDGGRVGPTATMYRVAVGPEVDLFDPKLTKWKMLVNAAFGWSFMTTDGLSEDCSTCAMGPLAKTGLKVAYPVGSSIDLWVGAEATWYFLDDDTDEDVLGQMETLNPRELQDPDFSNSWSFPLHAGLRINF